MGPPLPGEQHGAMSRIAKGRKTRCCQNKRSRRIVKSGGLRFYSKSPAAPRSVAGGAYSCDVGLPVALFIPTGGCVMRNHIDYVHSRAIVREIGERLRASLKPVTELPPRLKMQIDRLRELEEQSPSIIPAAEHWNKPRG
jgi:hypothetical protein